jgi:serine/threonine-protein phosphatase 2B regulatory subunit
MGASTSACLNAEDLEELQKICGFSTQQLNKMYQRFVELDRKQKGVLGTADLQLIPELAMNPLCHRIISLFDRDGNDSINFKHFVSCLWWFSPDCPEELKLKGKMIFQEFWSDLEFSAAFEVYDVNDDGNITVSDLQQILKSMVGTNMTDEQLAEIASFTIQDSDPENKGYLTYRDFTETIDAAAVNKALTITFPFTSY